jgi:hypothetical protein
VSVAGKKEVADFKGLTLFVVKGAEKAHDRRTSEVEAASFFRREEKHRSVQGIGNREFTPGRGAGQRFLGHNLGHGWCVGDWQPGEALPKDPRLIGEAEEDVAARSN